MEPKYYSLTELLNKIEEPNGSVCKRMLEENKERFSCAIGSSHNHQSWEGGYLDHLTEIMNIAILLYKPLNEARPLHFSLSDALLVLYLHDLEKPWKYQKITEGKWKSDHLLKDKETQVWPFVQKKIKEYNFELTDEHWNGIKYVEGEKNDYVPGKRTQNPLAAFAHLCDNWSARGWFDCPNEYDVWKGAKKSKEKER